MKGLELAKEYFDEYGRPLIENISICIGIELNRRGFTHTGEAFLQAHGDQLMESIGDERLRSLHIMVDFE